mgnify:CR=1
MKTVPIFTRYEYGHARVFVNDPAQAAFFLAFTKRNTLTPDAVKALQALGVTFQVVPDPKAQATDTAW